MYSELKVLTTGQVFEDERFERSELLLDGNRYERCTFYDCRLIYRGDDETYVTGSSFEQVSFVLDGPAERTMRFLVDLGKVRDGGQELLESFLNCLRAGVLPDRNLVRPQGVSLQ
jgi:hypothetical protein